MGGTEKKMGQETDAMGPQEDCCNQIYHQILGKGDRNLRHTEGTPRQRSPLFSDNYPGGDKPRDTSSDLSGEVTK